MVNVELAITQMLKEWSQEYHTFTLFGIPQILSKYQVRQSLNDLELEVIQSPKHIRRSMKWGLTRP